MIFWLFPILFFLERYFSYEINIQNLQTWSENFQNCNLLIQFGFYEDFEKPGSSLKPKFTNKKFNFWKIKQPYTTYDGLVKIKRKSEGILGTSLKWSLKCSAVWVFSPTYGLNIYFMDAYEPYYKKLFSNLETYIFTGLCDEPDILFQRDTGKIGSTTYTFLVCFQEYFKNQNKIDLSIICKIHGIIWFHYFSFYGCTSGSCFKPLNYFRKHSYREIDLEKLSVEFLYGTGIRGYKILDIGCLNSTEFSYIELYTMEMLRFAYTISNSTGHNELLRKWGLINFSKIAYRSVFKDEYNTLYEDLFIIENIENNFLTCSPLGGKSLNLVFFLSPLDTGTWISVVIVTVILFLFLNFGFWLKRIKVKKSIFLNLLAPFLEQGMEFEEFLHTNPWLYMPMILWLFAFGIVIANGYKSFVTSGIIVPLNEKFPNSLEQVLNYRYYPLDFSLDGSKSIQGLLFEKYYLHMYQNFNISDKFISYNSPRECYKSCKFDDYLNSKMIGNSLFSYHTTICKNSNHCIRQQFDLSLISKREKRFIYLYSLLRGLKSPGEIDNSFPHTYLLDCKSSYLVGNAQVLSSTKKYFDQRLVNKKFVLGHVPFLSYNNGLLLSHFSGHFFQDLIRYGIEYGILHFWEMKSTPNRVKEWENYKDNIFNITQEYPYKNVEPAKLSSNLQSVFIIFAILIGFCILSIIYEMILFHKRLIVFTISTKFISKIRRFFLKSAFSFFIVKNFNRYFHISKKIKNLSDSSLNFLSN